VITRPSRMHLIHDDVVAFLPALARWVAAMRSPITPIRASRSPPINRSDVDRCRMAVRLRHQALFEAGWRLKPDVASVNTYSDSHADYAIKAIRGGRHVFVEKPLATTVADARARRRGGQGQRQEAGDRLHPAPSPVLDRLIAEARELGGPYVFRMNFNQQSSGHSWDTHKQLMQTTSPIVDCGVHYLDVMCQITDAKPVEVRGMGVRMTDEIAPSMYNYGHLQVLFEDGSVGWYEAGWGPMISETAFFVKDVMSPKGSVSIVMDEGAKSDDVDTHTKTARIRVHHSEPRPDGKFERPTSGVHGRRTRPSGFATASRPSAEGDPRGYRFDPPHGRRRQVACASPGRRGKRA
jgi:predicted dehydrogenase